MRRLPDDIRQGGVYWVDFGAQAGSAPAMRHPCVVVQGDLFNGSNIGTTVVCLITSNIRLAGAPGSVALRKGDGGLPKASVINVSQILTIDRAELDERIGQLPSKIVDQIRGGLHILFERV